MTTIAEVQINKVIQACKRVRAGHHEPMAITPTSRHTFHWDEDEPPFVESPLSQQSTRYGITAQVEIYGDGQGQWFLEMVDQQNSSHVWDAPFEADHEALAECHTRDRGGAHGVCRRACQTERHPLSTRLSVAPSFQR